MAYTKRNSSTKRPRSSSSRTISKRYTNKTSIPRKMPAFDGMSVLVSAYFEVTHKMPTDAATQVPMAYAIRCNPESFTIQLTEMAKEANVIGFHVDNGDSVQVVPTGQTSGNLPTARYGLMREFYSQYKCTSTKISVTVDRECGLDNGVYFCNNKANVGQGASAAVVQSIQGMMAQAHKSYMPTADKRTLTYGYKPTGISSENAYRLVGQTLTASEDNHINVLQMLEPKPDAVCRHQVTVTMTAFLKDSKKNN